jgi:amino acid permease
MANNNDKASPFHEIPSSEYWWLPGDRALHKSTFKTWTLTVMVFTSAATAIACLTNWWQIMITALFTTVYINHWYIGFPVTFTVILVTYVWYDRRRKRLLREEEERRHMRKYREATIKQNFGGE